MKKSNDMRQGTSWDKGQYEPGDGVALVTSKSERMGDNTPESRGKHGSAQGRKNRMAGNGVNQTPAILDRNPAKSTKPWADGPAEPSSVSGHAPWVMAQDAGAMPPVQYDMAKGEGTKTAFLDTTGPNTAAVPKQFARDGKSTPNEHDLRHLSGSFNWSDANKVKLGTAGWKAKNYSMTTPSELPEGELKRKWKK